MIKWIRQRPADVVLLVSILACVFEGAFRKWVFREAAGPVKYSCYFAKDFIWIALVVLCRPRYQVAATETFKKVLSVGVPLVLIGAAISAAFELNLVGAVLSFRSLVLLPLLTYLTLPRLAGVKIDTIAFVIGGLTLLNVVLGTVQYSSPPDAAINYYANENTVGGATAFEENVRSTGTFSYITGYANLAEAGCWGGLVLLCLARGRLLYVFAGWSFYVASLICALVSISRATVITVLLMLVVLAISGKQVVSNVLKGIGALVVMLLLGYALSYNPLIVRLTDTVIERHELSEDTVEGRALDPIIEIGDAAGIAPIGVGFGTEQVAGVFADTGVMNFRQFEYQFPRLVLESGLLGLSGFLITCLGTLYVMFEVRRYVYDEGLRRVIVLSIFLVADYFYKNVAFNHIASYFAWMIVAVTLSAASRAVRSLTNSAVSSEAMLPALASGRL